MPIPLRVLIVEDSEDDAKLLLMELRRSGWEPTHQRVDTAAAMATALREGVWDLIVADYAMPKFDGRAALALARERAEDLPFILVSGTVGEETAVEAMKAGANDYLFKGNLKRLGPAVVRELRESQVRREARQTDRELSRRDGQLADAQRLARLGSWHADLRTGAASWSQETYRMFTRAPSPEPPSHQEFLDRLHPDDRRSFIEFINSPDVTWFAQDYRVVTLDGTTRFVQVRADVIRNDHGIPLEAAGMIQDITERKLAERQLQNAHDELAAAKDAAEAANRAKDHFLAILSHELRTPLTPVLAVVSHLERQPDLPAELRADPATIRDNVEMEARLIDDLLDLTRIVHHKMELHFEVVDAHAVLRRAVDLFRKEIDAKGLKVAMDLRAKRRHIWADPGRLQQVFVNLLSNAVKFTTSGGNIAVRTSNDPQGRLRMQFSDDGIGIESDVLPRLFHDFQQAERTLSRRYGGLGLGLSIARSLVEMHDGAIAAASDGRDRGTTITVDLSTVAAVEALASADGQPRQPPGAVAKSNGASRVLLVEDHNDTRRVMARLLKSFGCSVAAAASVEEALRIAERETFDLLVSDIGLPDGTGLDVMRQIQSRYPIRGIAVSGFCQDEDIRRSRDAGFEMHLTKPLDIAALQEAVQKVVYAQ